MLGFTQSNVEDGDEEKVFCNFENVEEGDEKKVQVRCIGNDKSLLPIDT